MVKIVQVTRDGDQFVMTVERDGGQKETWTYEREETSVGVSFIMVDRDDDR